MTLKRSILAACSAVSAFALSSAGLSYSGPASAGAPVWGASSVFTPGTEATVYRVTLAAGADAEAGASVKPSAEGGGASLWPDKVSFHKFAGWGSGTLFLAAGIVGAVRAYDMMNAGHKFRDTNDLEMGSPECKAEIEHVWNQDQYLRWTHVGLIAAGEGLYLSNAISGMSMATPHEKGKLTRSDLHRYAFFVHAGLMLAEGILGVMTTEALRRGDHEQMLAYAPAHVAIGFTIPAAIFASGAIIEKGWLVPAE